MRLLLSGSLAALLLALGTTAPASAASYGFDCISGNRASDCAIGEAQLRMDVTDAGSGKIAFTFTNVGTGASSITDIYWDDNKLFASIFAITNTPGLVEFSKGASPGNLPSANSASPKFEVTKGLLVDSDSPVQPRGVNPGESLVVTLALISGKSLSDVLSDLADGDLRVGLHVQGMGRDKCGSESFVILPGQTPPIPEPGSFGLVSLGMLGLAALRRSRH
jgi:hypothetical protein